MDTYVLGDVRDLQRFIFTSPQLLEMRGASALLDFFDRAVIPELCPEGAQRVFSGGGNFLVRFPDAAADDPAVLGFVAAARTAFFDLTQGHPLAVAVVAAQRFEEAEPELRRRLRRTKEEPDGLLAPASMPFLKRCESCGQEPADRLDAVGGQKRWIGPACLQKRRMHRELATARNAGRRARFAAYGLPGPIEVPEITLALGYAQLPRHFYELTEAVAAGEAAAEDVAEGRAVQLETPAGGDGGGSAAPPATGRAEGGVESPAGGSDDLALLVADGNGLGSWFEGLPLDDFRALSRTIDEGLRRAVDAAAAPLIAPGRPPLLQVLLLGGDDLVVALRARDALGFARRLLAGFRVEHPHDPDRTAGLAGGLVFCRPGFPFRQAHALAEELLHRAKRRCRDERDEGLEAALDLHRVTATHVRSLAAEHRELTRSDGAGRAWSYGAAGPYSPPELDALLGLAETLAAETTPSQRGRLRQVLSPRDDGPASPLHPRFGVPARVVAEYEAWRLRQEGGKFNRPLADLWEEFTAEDSSDRAITVRRWRLADALVLAELGATGDGDAGGAPPEGEG